MESRPNDVIVPDAFGRLATMIESVEGDDPTRSRYRLGSDGNVGFQQPTELPLTDLLSCLLRCEAQSDSTVDGTLFTELREWYESFAPNRYDQGIVRWTKQKGWEPTLRVGNGAHWKYKIVVAFPSQNANSRLVMLPADFKDWRIPAVGHSGADWTQILSEMKPPVDPGPS